MTSTERPSRDLPCRKGLALTQPAGFCSTIAGNSRFRFWAVLTILLRVVGTSVVYAAASAAVITACGEPSTVPLTPNIRATIQTAAATAFPTPTASLPAEAESHAMPRVETSERHQPLARGWSLALQLLATPTPGVASVEVQIVGVVSGDTVEARFRGGSIVRKVRLLGADAPDADAARGFIGGRQCVDDWARFAAEYASRLLLGRTVILVVDPWWEKRRVGGDGPLLAYVHVDGRDFNAELIAKGYAVASERWEPTRRARYRELQEQAVARGVGMWGC